MRIRPQLILSVFVPVVVVLLIIGFVVFKEQQNGTSEQISSSSSSSLEASSSVSVVSSSDEGPVQVEASDSAWFEISSPREVKRDEAGEIDYEKGKSEINFTGTNSPNIESMSVRYTSDYGDVVDDYQLKTFKIGDTTWKYLATCALKNLAHGPNEYRIRAYFDGGTKYLQKTIRVDLDGCGGSAQSKTSQAGNSASAEALTVQWHKPEVIPTLAFLKQTKAYDRLTTHFRLMDEFASYGYNDVKDSNSYDKVMEENIQLYQVGTVQGGEYDSNKVIIALVNDCMDVFDGPCVPSIPAQHFVQKSDGTFVRFEPNSIAPFNSTYDESHTINVSLPNKLEVPDSRYPLIQKGATREEILTSELTSKPLFVSSEINRGIYGGSDALNGCFFTSRDDGLVVNYSLDFGGDESLGNMGLGGKVTITWNNGKTTTEGYTHVFQTCNHDTVCHDVVEVKDNHLVSRACDYDQEKKQCKKDANGNVIYVEKVGRQLEKIGTTKNGEDVFRAVYSPEEIAAFSQKEYDKYANELDSVYGNLPRWNDSFKIPTPQEFYDSNPVIYIKDPLGRYIRFQKEQFQSGAECGKPVIYLYPQSEQDIQVQVKPTGGLTISDPDYGNGWKVRATPDSIIYNYANGKTYPYLFWEGHSKEYSKPKNGFVFEKKEVHNGMVDKLHSLGLNSKETADFLEFWEPKLTQSPYVFVTFVPQNQFDEMAPLTVQPQPDTTIRVFMDYEPLNAPLSVEPMEIHTPVRKGFAVVEWGGVLHNGNDNVVYVGGGLTCGVAR